MEQKRERINSKDYDSDHRLTMEEFTVVKLMEEIVEFDSEIKHKQKQINSRMKMLHQLLPKEDKTNKRQVDLVERFMSRMQPEYPDKISVEYKREGEGLHNAIPMPHNADVLHNVIPMPLNADVHHSPIELGSMANVLADVVPLMSQEDNSNK